MRGQRIAAVSPVPVPFGSVTGLGVCDVWRLELSAVQWLVDETDALRRPLEEELEPARAQHAATGDGNVAEEAEAWVHAYELRLLAAIRAQLPATGERRPVVVAGPAELRDIFVAGAVRNVVATLAEAVDDLRPSDPQGRERLAEVAEAAHAWVQTYIDSQELDAFSFDPTADPVRLR